MADPLVLTLHVGDYGYAVKLVQGDPSNLVDWNQAAFELLIWTPVPGLTPGPDSRVIVVAPVDLLVGRSEKTIHWLIRAEDLTVPGTYHWQVSDVRSGERRVLKRHQFEVAESIAHPTP